jgi:thioredoxin 1
MSRYGIDENQNTQHILTKLFSSICNLCYTLRLEKILYLLRNLKINKMLQKIKFNKIPAFLLVALVFFSCHNGTGQSKKTSLTPDEFEQQLAKTPDAQLIDVRTPDEYKDGHLKGAKNIDFNDQNFASGIAALDKNKPVFIYCLSGGRSSAAAEQMRAEGFGKVYEMQGGIMKWNAAGKSLVKEDLSKPKADLISAADFEKKVKDNAMVLADFSAAWCRPCRMLSPVIDTLADKNKGKLTVIRVDVDQNHEITQKLQVNELPTLLLFKNGKQVWRGEGYMPSDMIQQVIDKQ